jgi:hypothetical protein
VVELVEAQDILSKGLRISYDEYLVVSFIPRNAMVWELGSRILRERGKCSLHFSLPDAKFFCIALPFLYEGDESEAREFALVNLDVEAVMNTSARMSNALNTLTSTLYIGKTLTRQEWQWIKKISEAFQTEIACSLENIARWTSKFCDYAPTKKIDPMRKEYKFYEWDPKSYHTSTARGSQTCT